MDTYEATGEMAGSGPRTGDSYLRVLADSFVAPSKAFASIAAKPRWFLPFVLCILAGLAYETFTYSQLTDDMIESVRSEVSFSASEIERRVENIEASKEYGVAWQGVAKGLGLLTAFHAFKLFGLALVVWLALHLYATKVAYKSILALCSFVYLVVIPETLLSIPLVVARGTRAVYLGAAAFLPPDIKGSPLFNLCSEVEIFSVWMAVLLGIGLPIVAGISPKKAWITVGYLWVVWLLWSLLAGNLVQIT